MLFSKRIVVCKILCNFLGTAQRLDFTGFRILINLLAVFIGEAMESSCSFRIYYTTFRRTCILLFPLPKRLIQPLIFPLAVCPAAQLAPDLVERLIGVDVPQAGAEGVRQGSGVDRKVAKAEAGLYTRVIPCTVLCTLLFSASTLYLLLILGVRHFTPSIRPSVYRHIRLYRHTRLYTEQPGRFHAAVARLFVKLRV